MVNDITITNNVLKNVVSGIGSGAVDDGCGPGTAYLNCHNAGSQARWYIANNLFLFYDPTLQGGTRNNGFEFSPSLDRINGVSWVMHDVVFQHNTQISAPGQTCWNSMYFSVPGGAKPPISGLTNNIWILDNVLCRQPSGDWGLQGTSGLTQYMGVQNRWISALLAT